MKQCYKHFLSTFSPKYVKLNATYIDLYMYIDLYIAVVIQTNYLIIGRKSIERKD